MSCDSSGKYSFINDSGSVIDPEDLKGYFGQDKGHIVTLISDKQKEVKAQRLADNLKAVKAAAKVKSSPASFAIKNEKNEDVNVQLTCGDDGKVADLKVVTAPSASRLSSLFHSSSPTKTSLIEVQYQAFFGVDDINQ